MSTRINYGLQKSTEVLLTSEAGDRLASKKNITFQSGSAEGGPVIRIQPDRIKQTLSGIGTSFTESSAFVLAHLPEAQRSEVMKGIFSDQGANFSLTRTPIGACDFCVDGRYSYDDVAGDITLEHFDISPDQDGFSRAKYSGIKDESFDLLPMIQQAIEIKLAQSDSELNIIASAWTAPAWMKDIEDWYVPGCAENGFDGTGGALKNE